MSIDATTYLTQELGLKPTTSRVRMAEQVSQLGFDDQMYRQMVLDLTGRDIGEDTSIDTVEYDFVFRYLVDGIVFGDAVDVALEKAIPKAHSFVEKNQWVLTKPEYSSSYERKSEVDAAGNPKQKKGAKKQLAKKIWMNNQDKEWKRKDWIKVFMDEVGLTQNGASTYHYNFKNNVW